MVRVLVLLCFCGVWTGLPVSHANAGQLVELCNTRMALFSEEGRRQELVKCYKREMLNILDLEESKKLMDAAIIQIRGAFVPGSASKHADCGSGQNPQRTDGNGFCSAEWDAYADARHEYYRLYCHIEFGFKNEYVIASQESAKAHRKSYNACFDRSIPSDIQDFFRAGNRQQFGESYRRILEKIKELDPIKDEFDDLVNACNAVLADLKKNPPINTTTVKISCNV